jgi:hypothetical protein
MGRVQALAITTNGRIEKGCLTTYEYSEVSPEWVVPPFAKTIPTESAIRSSVS